MKDKKITFNACQGIPEKYRPRIWKYLAQTEEI